jgi:hypothetical protein
MLLGACASGGGGGQLGDYAVHTPSLTTVQGEERPTHLNVSLSKPGYVAVLFVIPGRGASVIYPADSSTNNYLTAGAQQITTAFSDRNKLIDTTFLPRRIAGADSARRRPPTSRSSPQIPRFDPSQLVRAGYLLMITTEDPLNIAQVNRRIEGVSIPMEDSEALNAVAKLVVGTTQRNKPWAGFFREVEAK